MSLLTAEILAGAAVLGGVTVLLAIVLLRLLLNRIASTDTPIEEFSIARYQIMARLTSEEDFEFLGGQPGYHRSIGARLRRERRRIFRMYLRSLARDFHTLHAAARKAVADSPALHADLVGLLVRCQMTFWRRMFLVELRLLTPAAQLPKLDIAALLQPIESIQIHMPPPLTGGLVSSFVP